MIWLYRCLYLSSILFLSSCMSRMSSLNDSMRHERDLAFDEMRVELGDLSHSIQALRTESQLLQERLREQEGVTESLSKYRSRFDSQLQQLSWLEKKYTLLEKQQERIISDLKTLSKHFDQSGSSLSSTQEKVRALQAQVDQQSAHLHDIQQLKSTLNQVSKAIREKDREPETKRYRVKAGDNLEKISKQAHVSIAEIMKRNHLNTDKIYVGQELDLGECEL
jgi:LysM repeat protein